MSLRGYDVQGKLVGSGDGVVTIAAGVGDARVYYGPTKRFAAHPFPPAIARQGAVVVALTDGRFAVVGGTGHTGDYAIVLDGSIGHCGDGKSVDSGFCGGRGDGYECLLDQCGVEWCRELIGRHKQHGESELAWKRVSG